jgi:tRNA-dependent cyclodipeptide synthase
MNTKDLLVIGISPGNGYFKEEVLKKLLLFSLIEYKNILIFIPDIPAISTYVALGYPENIARRDKAIRQGNAFRNKINKIISEDNLPIDRIFIFDWKKENIENLDVYRESFLSITNLYEQNSQFNKDIKSATRSVLEDNPFKKKEIEENDVEIGTHYILSEFAFMVFLAKSFKEYSNFIYGYHNQWPVWEDFIAEKYCDDVDKNKLKFLILPNFS